MEACKQFYEALLLRVDMQGAGLIQNCYIQRYGIDK